MPTDNLSICDGPMPAYNGLILINSGLMAIYSGLMEIHERPILIYSVRAFIYGALESGGTTLKACG